MRWLFCLWVMASCTGNKAGTDSGSSPTGPEIVFQEPDGTFVAGDSVDFSVTATDPDGVESVTVYHRTVGGEYWDSTDLVQDSAADTWSGTVDGLEAPGLEYVFKATDRGDPPAVSFYPAAGTDDPLELTVVPAAQALPFTEDFESDTSLQAMDWWSPSDAFAGDPWQVTTLDAHGGSQAAFHPRGYSGTGELQDWLISPALDFSTLDQVMVTWYELGANTDAAGTHALYVSTGSRLPRDGDFEKVADLAIPPEDGWTRSDAVDLSAYAGQPVVYLAWYYDGTEADDWYLDDVTVQELAADLSASLSWDPDPVHPGERTTVTVTLANGTNAEATGLSAELEFPDGGASVSGDASVPMDDIAALGGGSVSWDVIIDSALHDNRYLPVRVTLTDGSMTWIWSFQLTVGVPSKATVDLSLDESASVQVSVGVGDPDAPEVEYSLADEMLEAGEHTLSADITNAYDLLPPEAGDHRWFARVNSSATGVVNRFVIDYGGTAYSATVLPTVEADSPGIVWLPEPPSPELVSVSPSAASPGDTGLNVGLRMVNTGADTSGPVTGTLVSMDSDVTVTSGATFTVDPDIWETNEVRFVTGPVIAISPDHTDSTPVQLQLQMDDGVDGFTSEFEIPVPWPVLKITQVAVDDSGGDGILDPGESATLDVTVANSGDLGSFGIVRGTLSLASTSTASATLTSDTDSFGLISSGRTKDGSFDLEVTSGSDGDTLDLVLDLDDGTATWQATAQIVLGEPPWLALASADDPTGDELDGYGFDFVNAKYRVVDGVVQLRIESAVEYDPSTLFIEAWGLGSGASYTYYRWIYQAGSTTMQGYNSGAGFTTIGTLTASAVSTTELELEWDTADMGLVTDSFLIGLAAGWCGPPEYYCDEFPDNWGYPYDSFTVADWYTVSW